MGERMVDLVEEGFDVAIRATVPADSSLVIRQLSAWRHVPCAAPSYLDAHGRPAHPADLAGHNCLRYAFYPYGDEWRFTGPDGRRSAPASKAACAPTAPKPCASPRSKASASSSRRAS